MSDPITEAREALLDLFTSPVGDPETEHIRRDEILISLVKSFAPDIAAIVEAREEEQEYWYA